MAGIATKQIGGDILQEPEQGSRPATRPGYFAQEHSVTTKAIIFTVVPVLALLAFLWIALSMDTGAVGERGQVADVTMELLSVHRAATQAGILQVRSDDPAAVGAWLAEAKAPVQLVPDLAPAGMTLRGARVMGMAGGDWTMLQYSDPSGRLADVLLVAVPTGRVAVPDEAVAERIGAHDVFLDRVHGVAVVYTTLGGTDWMLVSSDEDDVVRRVFGTLAERLS